MQLYGCRVSVYGSGDTDFENIPRGDGMHPRHRARRLLLQFDVIQCLVHRQFTEHDHLRNAQQGLAM